MRLRVIKMLGIIRPISKETLNAMIKSLADPDGEVRNQAVSSLGTIGPEAAPRSPLCLRSCTRRPKRSTASGSRARNDWQTGRAVTARGAAEGGRPEPAAARLLALGGLGRPIEPTALPVLIAALRDKDERVRGTRPPPWRRIAR